MSRRTFLLRSAQALALSAFPWRARASGVSPQLGFSLYGMKALPLREAIAACAEIGYGNVELNVNAGWPAEPKQLSDEARTGLREQLEALGLKVSALMLNLSLAVNDEQHARQLEMLRKAGKLAQDLSPAQRPPIETMMGGKSAEWEKLKSSFVERLHSWSQAAEAIGASVVVKAHVDHAVDVPERLLWLMERTTSPAIGAVYDFSHFQLAGCELAASLRQLRPYIRFIHVKDAEGTPAEHHFLLPGKGRTDYRAYFALLRELDYHGPIVVEVSAQVSGLPGYDPLTAARECYASLASALAP